MTTTTAFFTNPHVLASIAFVAAYVISIRIYPAIILLGFLSCIVLSFLKYLPLLGGVRGGFLGL